MEDSGPGSGPGLLRYFKPCRKDPCQTEHMIEIFPGRCPLSHLLLYKLRKHIDSWDYLAHFYIQFARQGWVSNYHGNLECN